MSGSIGDLLVEMDTLESRVELLKRDRVELCATIGRQRARIDVLAAELRSLVLAMRCVRRRVGLSDDETAALAAAKAVLRRR